MKAMGVILVLVVSAGLWSGCSLVIDTDAGGGNCGDGYLNGDETDVDCGGTLCDACPNMFNCEQDSDCESGNCAAGICAAAAHCSNGDVDGGETDVDCGGTECPGCALWQECARDEDCDGGYCGKVGGTAGVCADGHGDEDGDAVDNLDDNCPTVPNGGQDPSACGCADDYDCDLHVNADDNCPSVPNDDQADMDHDGLGDVCDSDADGDYRGDAGDNCLMVANPHPACSVDGDCRHAGGTCRVDEVCSDQLDTDEDGFGDECDNCPLVANPGQEDTDGNGTGDVCDCPGDGDCDTVPDGADNCPSVSNQDQSDQDGDTLGDACDNCPATWNDEQQDRDSNGVGDHCQAISLNHIYPLDDGEIVFLDDVVVVTWPVEGFAAASAYPDLFWVAATRDGDAGGVAVVDQTGQVDVWPELVVDIVGTVRTDQRDYPIVEVIERRTDGIQTRLPDPMVVAFDDLATDAGSYVGQVVQVQDVHTSTDVVGSQAFSVQPPAGASTLKVGDLFADHREVQPQATLTFTSLAGVVELDGGDPLLQPRWCDDLQVAQGPVCDCKSFDIDTNLWLQNIHNRASEDRVFEGCPVDLSGVVVTAVGDGGAFVQLDNSNHTSNAIFVYAPGASVTVGNLAHVSDAVYRVRMGRRTLDTSSQGELVDDLTLGTERTVSPGPITDLLADEASVRSLDGSLVVFDNVQISDTRGPDVFTVGDDFGDFQIKDQTAVAADPALTVGWMFRHGAACPAALVEAGELDCVPADDSRQLGETFTSIQGILTFADNHWRLEPRDCADFDPAPNPCLQHPEP